MDKNYRGSKGNMILLYVLSVIALCSAQDGTESVKLDNGNEASSQKFEGNVESLMRQVGEMGMIIENYRKVILGGIAEADDVCGFIEELSDVNDIKSVDGNLTR